MSIFSMATTIHTYQLYLFMWQTHRRPAMWPESVPVQTALHAARSFGPVARFYITVRRLSTMNPR